MMLMDEYFYVYKTSLQWALADMIAIENDKCRLHYTVANFSVMLIEYSPVAVVEHCTRSTCERGKGRWISNRCANRPGVLSFLIANILRQCGAGAVDRRDERVIRTSASLYGVGVSRSAGSDAVTQRAEKPHSPHKQRRPPSQKTKVTYTSKEVETS